MKIEGTCFVVNGAGSEIGQKVARGLAEQGARLLVIGPHQATLDELVALAPERIVSVCADLAYKPGRDAVVIAACAEGRVQGLINCVGPCVFSLFESQDDAALESVIESGLTSVLQLTRRMLPLLRAADEAVVLNVGSALGAVGYPGFVACCASRFALRGMSEALRRELADTRIRVLYVASRPSSSAMFPWHQSVLSAGRGATPDASEALSDAVLATLRSGREETCFGWPARAFIRLNRWVSRCVNPVFRRRIPGAPHALPDASTERK